MRKKTYTLTSDKYAGKYVALISFSDRKVLASGKNPDRVYLRAEAKGYKSPLVFFVPQTNKKKC